jgi:hypothetical protein
LAAYPQTGCGTPEEPGGSISGEELTRMSGGGDPLAPSASRRRLTPDLLPQVAARTTDRHQMTVLKWTAWVRARPDRGAVGHDARDRSLAVAGGLATPVAAEAKSCDLRYLEPNITSLHATGAVSCSSASSLAVWGDDGLYAAKRPSSVWPRGAAGSGNAIAGSTPGSATPTSTKPSTISHPPGSKVFTLSRARRLSPTSSTRNPPNRVSVEVGMAQGHASRVSTNNGICRVVLA